MSFERTILSTFFELPDASWPACEPLEAGLINATYKVTIPHGSKESGLLFSRTFSRFYACLWAVDLSAIQPAIPNFLDFAGRIAAFQQALPAAEENRQQTAKQEIAFVTEHLELAAKFIVLQKEQLPLRLIHGDPKISNLLFDRTGTHGRCVIDQDTLMPGTLLYDYGDMIRSYTNNRTEDDPDAQDVFNADVYDAVTAGFLYYLQDKLTAVEKENLHYSAQVVVFIQAIRFLTDYLRGDVYYKTTYPLQNLYRTRNQINLLRALLERGGIKLPSATLNRLMSLSIAGVTLSGL